MHKSIRAAAVATAALLAVGVSAPSSLAAPHAHAKHHAAHVKTAHTKSAHANTGHGKAAAEQRKADRAQAKLAREAARKERAIARNVRDFRFHGIAADQVATVKANADADVAGLQTFAGQAAAATTLTDVRAVAAQVHAVRPEGYLILENELRRAGRLQAQVDAALAADPTAAVTDVTTSLQSAVDKALAYHATDGKAVLRSIRADLAAAATALEALTGASDPTTPTP